MSSPRQPLICYLCGKKEEDLAEKLTSDHVVAAGFFAPPKPNNLLTLPCCLPCQKEYRDDEEYVRNSLSAISNLSENKDAFTAWKTTHRALKRRPALNADFRSRISAVEVHGAKLPGLQFSQQRTVKVIKKMIAGLHYHHTGNRLSDTVETEVFYNPDVILEDSLRLARYKGYFGSAFSYAGAVSREGDAAIWWLSFYASVLFIVVLTPPTESQV
jgi:hypothetical protein